ncbi:hypothetical protein O181_011647 [Austropuccinia psidii MF-1]|uniref:Uncharacterized protein n=1 Tax=Austropuccinia psidii MF-1 TaxID=1389203 RepID=A0A9Q3BW40_9BASI|nr:hypothetical protein [Austropuccinia psidii MF-1]
MGSLIQGLYLIFNSQLTDVVRLTQIHQYTKKDGSIRRAPNELTKNTFHLIGAINISTGWTVSMDDENAFAEHWKKFCLSNQHLLPKKKSKPNHHFADDIPEHF